ncbi:hypothetical protein EVJ50_13070 [Synechococcus sp. RSCCF101]|uniref:hypothetical protein n=1 Tax=Synechococcus sp. RSCCF101 TaxID=2511069 RepID=UPI001246713E|nr:hypothetical protein [Synechococcus sp. RSCCF101]QEY33019.1 hypothetical protein EVJ50_13070 [Synechococcus sp. RSCCF101]
MIPLLSDAMRSAAPVQVPHPFLSREACRIGALAAALLTGLLTGPGATAQERPIPPPPNPEGSGSYTIRTRSTSPGAGAVEMQDDQGHGERCRFRLGDGTRSRMDCIQQ